MRYCENNVSWLHLGFALVALGIAVGFWGTLLYLAWRLVMHFTGA